MFGLALLLLGLWAGALWLREDSPKARWQGLATGAVAHFEFFDSS